MLGLAGVGVYAANAPARPDHPALRIGIPAATTAPCAPPAAGDPVGAHAYYKLIAERLDTTVLACPFATHSEAAAALADGTVDTAIIDAVAFRPHETRIRAILTVRDPELLPRVPVIAAVRKDDRRRTLGSLKGSSVAFGGKSIAYYDHEWRALAGQGIGKEHFARETVAESAEDALALVRKKSADVALLNSGAWRRACTGTGTGAWLCDDLIAIWRGRPRAALAIAVRRDMVPEIRYRFIGVHVAMHADHPDAFNWGSSHLAGRAAEFEPAEADALILTKSAGKTTL
ncbi:MAG: PhnD/SsuA/transferrin family substrate-binding protein [Sphingomonadaceae bacterium]